MNLEWRGHDLILRCYPGIAWRAWEKPRNKSGRIAGLRTEIWTGDLPNTKREDYPLNHDVWYGTVLQNMHEDLTKHIAGPRVDNS
jgi:hypothetical protein